MSALCTIINEKNLLQLKVKELELEVNKIKLSKVEGILTKMSTKTCRNDGNCDRKDCIFAHPNGKAKITKICRNNGSCDRKDCIFAHPNGKAKTCYNVASSRTNSIFYEND
jgi:hypothetical protein